ncbi:hypothetical protein A3K29_00025 [Candidatus Collierbacteria bacterium RIFOXYB2_FULL_46_14]|uniref:Uncharacterized protein n=1 Tax=Candidatus Collierbacteria bacterium GW2011_GWA2_46_26 TaxID=1618381 RepID=A0A0G1PI66_9BACT|nr:MAG: hypothetical protein UW29_C0012G0017 [Candidatus Collierbacteria bacterium GW2011_GWC2_44_13]KKU32456.1 MAG: hypothetical protein UX47_C0011G0017 [Candidatus Collierbacteria bacterium GW2011_GWA2_46_26]OGD72527.1 MAG: hypothetical protein A3K29_00025 [Candidatus Collierbacteria bacterium RIFOXYB2_FULL_46_14]OGD75569.1 MAG: hypothetical protein A3K43_00025 [Candidatus Collierbacteria bacterium RIFOXYA2_FULL_46_20]OGD76905.1 MAG: hypothetical protein A3K39_00025 [Candidatus Collierbacteri
MPDKVIYRLTLSILFSTEKDLEHAISTFSSWCKQLDAKDKQYGFVRSGQLLGELFLVSSLHFEGWQLFRLVQALELNGLVSVTKNVCLQIVPK